MKQAGIALTFAACLCAAGCALGPLPPPEATLDTIQAIRGAALAPMRVGDFRPGPGAPTAMDRSLAVRAGAQAAPGGSFARYLGDTLAAELKGAGFLDPSAGLVVSGVITDSHLDSALPKAHARLAARFTVVRGGAAVYEKTLNAAAEWDSNFIGAVAIPDAFNHYMGLFPELVRQLVTDPEFRKAAGRA
jgi:hypothetical protein